MNQIWIKIIAALPLSPTTVLIQNGKALVKRGKLKHSLISDLNDLAKSSNIETACFHASKFSGHKFKLSVYGIPKNLEQRFRNVWAANIH